MKTIDILREARALIAKGWAQGAFARDKCGSKVLHYSPDACAWCLSGALRAAWGGSEEYLHARNFVVAVIGASCLPTWNDAPDRTKEDVLAALDEVISRVLAAPITMIEHEGL